MVVCLLCIPVGLLPPQRGDLGRLADPEPLKRSGINAGTQKDGND